MALEAGKFRQAIIESTLRSCQLFVGLPAADIEALASFVVLKQLEKGEYLFSEGDLGVFTSFKKGPLKSIGSMRPGKNR